ncbi:retinoblastoma binding protein 9 [Nannochloropsis oceanica]
MPPDRPDSLTYSSILVLRHNPRKVATNPSCFLFPFFPPCFSSRAAGIQSLHKRRRTGISLTARKKKGGQTEGERTEKPRKAKSSSGSSKPRLPVFTARIVILGSPSEEWGQGVREGLITEGWMEERVQVLPVPSPEDYPEVKWMAYLREGLKLRNTTFVIAAPGSAAGQVLRFLEKHPLRGSILLGPESTYEGRAWDYKLLRQHCPFFGLIYPMGEGDEGWEPPADAERIRDGLGLAPFPFGIRATPEGQEMSAVAALIRDWQFLECLGMGPIQLVGEDEEEEEEAKAKAKATGTKMEE